MGEVLPARTILAAKVLRFNVFGPFQRHRLSNVPLAADTIGNEFEKAQAGWYGGTECRTAVLGAILLTCASRYLSSDSHHPEGPCYSSSSAK